MKTLKIGDCPICGEIIYTFKRFPLIEKTSNGIVINLGKRAVDLNEKGRHFWILETTGSRMMVSICKDCFSQLDDSQVRAIYSDIVYTKLKQIEKIKDENKKQKVFDLIRTTEVYKWFGEEKEVIGFLNVNKNGQSNRTR